MGILNTLLRAVTWWNSQTLEHPVSHLAQGYAKVGEDSQGNVFYISSDGKRWVIYNGEAEASSRVDPDWHGWLHYTYDEPPTEKRPWPTRPGKSRIRKT